jgi:hypothetical protein
MVNHTKIALKELLKSSICIYELIDAVKNSTIPKIEWCAS